MKQKYFITWRAFLLTGDHDLVAQGIVSGHLADDEALDLIAGRIGFEVDDWNKKRIHVVVEGLRERDGRADFFAMGTDSIELHNVTFEDVVNLRKLFQAGRDNAGEFKSLYEEFKKNDAKWSEMGL